ncbi:hypothetical protein PUN4_20039 [Paraburkholderia unamae]|nr:hypothetical protein PUN4_20039 [Paraburkholderia unamae]
MRLIAPYYPQRDFPRLTAPDFWH